MRIRIGLLVALTAMLSAVATDPKIPLLTIPPLAQTQVLPTGDYAAGETTITSFDLTALTLHRLCVHFDQAGRPCNC